MALQIRSFYVRRPSPQSRRMTPQLGKPCPYCGVTMNRDKGWNSPDAPSRDHKIPRSRGGNNLPNNIVICCRSCNEDKGSLDAEEYMAVLTGLACRIDHIWHARRGLIEPKRLEIDQK